MGVLLGHQVDYRSLYQMVLDFRNDEEKCQVCLHWGNGEQHLIRKTWLVWGGISGELVV